jgi:glycine betaine/proline transport system substrate-binding protein
MKKIFMSLILSIFLSLFAVGCDGAAGDKTTINIGKAPYPHEWVVASIIQQIAEELGYDTEMVEGDIGFMFLGLSQGDIDIYPDVWLPTLHKTYVDKYEDDIELTGTIYKNAAIGLAVPSYVDISSTDELEGRGAEFDNRVVGIEPSSGTMLTAKKVLEEYGLEDEYELLESSTPAMLGEVEQAFTNEQPILFLAWRPHTMFTDYDIKLLEDPKNVWVYDDCFAGVSKGLKDKAPHLYEFTKSFKISLDEIEAIMSEMDKGKDLNQLAKEWVEQNRNKVDEMLGK